jgi:hypothetical protein
MSDDAAWLWGALFAWILLQKELHLVSEAPE